MGTSISLNHGKWQLTFRGQYVGRYATREEAQAQKDKLLKENPPLQRGGKREGAGRKKKER